MMLLRVHIGFIYCCTKNIAHKPIWLAQEQSGSRGAGVTFSFTPYPRFRTPPLWRLTGLQLTSIVKVTKLTGVVFTFTVGGITFTVSDETYRHCPVCTYVSFITNCKSFITDCKSYATDCKSENSAYKFWQLLQSVTIARMAIRLTVTRGGWLKLISYTQGGRTKSIFLFSFTPPSPGHTKRGANENVSPVIDNCVTQH